MTMITPSYLGETIEYSSLHACRSTLEDPTCRSCSRPAPPGPGSASDRVQGSHPLRLPSPVQRRRPYRVVALSRNYDASRSKLAGSYNAGTGRQGKTIPSRSTGNVAAPSTEQALAATLAGFAPERTNLLPALHSVQHALGYLPAWAMQEVGRQLHIPASEVHGVASGYTEFRFDPPAAGLVQVCTGLSCRLAGADALLAQARARRPDAVETIPCLFLCALAPVIAQGEELTGRVDARLLEEAQIHA